MSINSSADSKTETALLNESTCSFGTKALFQIHASNKREKPESVLLVSLFPRNALQRGRETGDSDWECAGRRSRAHSGAAWDRLEVEWDGVFISSAFGKESQVRKKSATLLQKSLLSSSIQDWMALTNG